MELTACGTKEGNLVLTERCLVSIRRPTRQATGLAKTLGIAAGFALGGAAGVAMLLSDEDDPGLLGQPGGLLNLGDAREVPPFECIEKVLTCWASEAPVDLVQSEGWPRKLEEEARITFFPRTRIRSMRLGFGGTLTADVDGPKDLEASVHFWEVGKLKRQLKRLSYPLR